MTTVRRALLLWLVSSITHIAYAQDHDKAAAEALFSEGRKLMAAGDYRAACAKLEASQQLDAGVGTQLNLADCYEKLGKTASAWALFRETITAARNAGSADRERIAKQRADALEPQLSYLTIVAPATLSVMRDDAPVDPAVLGSAIPVDPGTYQITASAPGKQAWSDTIEVGANAARVSVNVPILSDAPSSVTEAEAEARPAAVSSSVVLPPSAAASEAPSGSAQRRIGIITAGVGVAGFAVGTVFGLQAAARWSDAKANCDPYPYCGEHGQRLARDAKQSGTISTIAFIAGGVLFAGGVTLWLSAPSHADRTALVLGPGSLALHGTFQ